VAPLQLFCFGLIPFTVNIRYIHHRRATLFFFYRRRYFLHILALVFRTCLANGRDGVRNVRKCQCDVSDIFVQYYPTVRCLDII
jgi:hypothetical protein